VVISRVFLRLIPKIADNDTFHRGDFGRQQGARCAVVRVQQAVRNAAGGQKRPALRVGRLGAPGALRRLPDASIALRNAPTRATGSAPMKCVIISDLRYEVPAETLRFGGARVHIWGEILF
jgi:hypothetical protein